MSVISLKNKALYANSLIILVTVAFMKLLLFSNPLFKH